MIVFIIEILGCASESGGRTPTPGHAKFDNIITNATNIATISSNRDNSSTASMVTSRPMSSILPPNQSSISEKLRAYNRRSSPIFAPKDAYFLPQKTKELSQSANQVIKKLFGTFRYKGLGIGFAKSLNNMKGCGIGCRIPISSCFPGYDSITQLPKINGNLGVVFPANHIKFDLAASVPLPVVMYGILAVVKSKEFADMFKSSLKATDSVKRVGATLSFKMNPKTKIITPSIAPQLWIVLPRHLFSALLPVVLVAPTALIAIVGLFLAAASSVGMRTSRRKLDELHQSSEPPSPIFAPLEYLAHYWLVVKLWIATYAAGMGLTFSKPYTRTGGSSTAIGAQFNVDSLYPFYSLFSKRT